jgi:hypothetical protein
MAVQKVNYGCGLSVAPDWLNFDASPTLRIQRIPFLGSALTRGRVRFPDLVRFGDITKRLPLNDRSCEAAYCSHVLEHLSLEDCRIALRETFRILQPGGVFRGVMPDLNYEARRYLESKEDEPAHTFMRSTLLGMETRPRGLFGYLTGALGNSLHLWLWDYPTIAKELEDVGFANVRQAQFADHDDDTFAQVEDVGRWTNCLGFECWRP